MVKLNKKMIKNLRLGNGREIPPIGMGTYRVANLEEIIRSGLSTGYRLIDTARLYENEAEIGKCLSQIFSEEIIKREELFIVSKLQNTNHRPREVIPAIKKSLADLQLEYLDLYLIHWPVACKPTENEIEKNNFIEDDGVTLEETWRAMEECVKFGYAKSIGVSNFNSAQIRRICDVGTVKPLVNQVECNPYFCPKKLIDFCTERDIVIMAYSPLYRPGRYALMLLEEPILKELAEKHNRSPAQIVFRYLIQLGVIPVTMSGNSQHLKENFDIFDFSLNEEDIQMIIKIHRNLRCNSQERFKTFKEYPFAIEF